ncbi:MAG: YdcF family protein [Clostridia bacterium]|nr:YdcF family protein [Clostridia bacterium]
MKKRKDRPPSALSKRKRALLAVLITLLALGLVLVVTVAIINAVVVSTTADRVLDEQSAAALTDVDYILVLGAGVRADGTPSDMLHDRVVTAVSLWEAGADGMLLMSADNQNEDYNEVAAMVDLAVSLDVSDEVIETDRLGLSTYESLARAKELYGADRIIIVTQEYHLYRALYIAQELGIQAYGVSADVRSYRGQVFREMREIAARCKDFLVVLFD